MKNQKLKILVFASYYLPHNYGITVCVNELVKRACLKAEKVTILTPHLFKNSLDYEIIYGNVEVIRFPAFYLVFNYPVPKFWSIKFWKIFLNLVGKRNNYNLVITTIRFFYYTFWSNLRQSI